MRCLMLVLPCLLIACGDKGGGGDMVDLDDDGSTSTDDCDDDDASVHPGADELCDGIDNDCDGVVDDDPIDATSWHADADEDGFGAEATSVVACEQPEGHVADDTDCDDDDDSTIPGGTEVCDGADNDCDGVVDEDTTESLTWYRDADGDGYGTELDQVDACSQPEGYVAAAGDCLDTDDAIHPDADELCDGIDQDCDDVVDGAVVTFTYADGTDVDASLLFGLGSAGSPAELTMVEEGTFTICEGTWYVNLEATADVGLVGRGDPDAVVLSGGGAGTVLTVAIDGLAVDIANLTITEGQATWEADHTGLGGSKETGGGVLCAAEAELFLTEVAITANHAEGRGGGLAIAHGCRVEGTEVTLSANTASFGAAVEVNHGSLVLTDSLVDHNEAGLNAAILAGWHPYDEDDGVAAVVELHDTLVDGNSSAYAGGLAIYEWADVTCTGSATVTAGFTRNEGPYGAAIHIDRTQQDGTVFTADACDFGSGPGGDENVGNTVFLGVSGDVFDDLGDDATFACTVSDCE